MKIGNKLNYYNYLLYGCSFGISNNEYNKLIELTRLEECVIDDCVRGLINSNYLYVDNDILYYNYDVIYKYGLPNDSRCDELKELEIIELVTDIVKMY